SGDGAGSGGRPCVERHGARAGAGRGAFPGAAAWRGVMAASGAGTDPGAAGIEGHDAGLLDAGRRQRRSRRATLARDLRPFRRAQGAARRARGSHLLREVRRQAEEEPRRPGGKAQLQGRPLLGLREGREGRHQGLRDPVGAAAPKLQLCPYDLGCRVRARWNLSNSAFARASTGSFALTASSTAPGTATYPSPSSRPVYTRFPTQPRLSAGRLDSSACGSAAQVGRPMAGASAATPAAWAASISTMSFAVLPRTSTRSGGHGIFDSGA